LVRVTQQVFAKIMNVAFGRSWARVSTLPLELTEGLIILMERV
jgi:hypothetical protein